MLIHSVESIDILKSHMYTIETFMILHFIANNVYGH